MKRVLKLLPAAIVIIVILSTGCMSSTEKVEKATDGVAEAELKLELETKAYKDDVEAFKISTANQIAANEKSIAEFNKRIENQKSKEKLEYEKKIDELNNKNSDMKKRVADFKTDNKKNWDSFKVEFNNDMSQLGAAFRDFTIKNDK
jgi:outer membrane murein-binding lipoprotein Lpp